jgi:subtilase family serine protease
MGAYESARTATDGRTVSTSALARVGFAVLLLALACLMLAGAPAVLADTPVGTPALVPAGAQPLGAVSSSTQLDLDVVLRPRNVAELEAAAAAVTNPSSAEYEHFLPAGAFGPRFGATPQTIAAVDSALSAAGLTPGAVSSNDLSIPVRASAAQAEAALDVRIDGYRLPEGRVAHAAVSAPRLPSSVAGDIQAIAGLSNVAVRKPLLRQGRAHSANTPVAKAATFTAPAGAPSACSAAKAVESAGAVTPLTIDRIAHAYDLDPLYEEGRFGAGVTVGLYELEGTTDSDISEYKKCFTINDTVEFQTVGAAPAPAATKEEEEEYGSELDLDVEDVIGMAPKAKVIVYESSEALALWSEMIEKDEAKIISTSWGECEQTDGRSEDEAEARLFEQAALQGQTIFDAAGDLGAQDCIAKNGNRPAQHTEAAVDANAGQPYVTGVGGTELKLNENSETSEETVWNEGPYTGENDTTGGGESTFWRMPLYQYDALRAQSTLPAASSAPHCSAPITTKLESDSEYCREVPDVSADAAGKSGYIIYTREENRPQWVSSGGTSGAAPTWAGMVALADECLSTADPEAKGLGLINPELYRLYEDDYANAFRDITVGNNDDLSSTFNPADGFAAGTGYDMASGLGSPHAGGTAGVVEELCGQAAAQARKPAEEKAAAEQKATEAAQAAEQAKAAEMAAAQKAAAEEAATEKAAAEKAAAERAPTSVTAGPAPAPLLIVGSPAPKLALAVHSRGANAELGSVSCAAGCTVSVGAVSSVAGLAGHGHKHDRAVSVAKLELTVGPGQTKQLKLVLNATGKRLLKRLRQLSVTVTIKVVPAAGSATETVTRRVTFTSA